VRFVRFALRDIGVAALTLAAFDVDRRIRGRAPRSAEIVSGVGAGLLAALLGFVAHEWGHLAGALASGGVAHEPERVTSTFLFRFDVEKSSRASFLAMSYGGYAGTALAAAAIAALVPRQTLAGKVALGATALGLVATFALEIPTTVRVARGGPLPSGGVYAGTPTS
jgi:hypothetical protein